MNIAETRIKLGPKYSHLTDDQVKAVYDRIDKMAWIIAQITIKEFNLDGLNLTSLKRSSYTDSGLSNVDYENGPVVLDSQLSKSATGPFLQEVKHESRHLS